MPGTASNPAVPHIGVRGRPGQEQLCQPRCQEQRWGLGGAEAAEHRGRGGIAAPGGWDRVRGVSVRLRVTQVTQSPGPARPDLCLTPAEPDARKAVPWQARGQGRVTGCKHSRAPGSRAPEARGCDTPAEPSEPSIPEGGAAAAAVPPLPGCSPCHGSRPGTRMLWGGCQDLPGAPGSQGLPSPHCCSP